MIITISGLPGAGKTSVAKELAKRLGYKFFSVGDVLGQLAVERGITADELKALGPESDKLIDQKQIEFAQKNKNAIIEGWVSWKLVSDSFKLLITVDPNEGARRVFAEIKSGDGKRADERVYTSVEDTKAALSQRVENHRQRIFDLYGFNDILDPKNFDFILDTTEASGPSENADKIIEEMKKRKLID